MMLRRFLVSAVLLLTGFAHADWAADRDGSAGYVTVTTLATVVDEAVPFVYVKLSDLPADFHTAMDAASDTDGKTIRVSTSDGATQLACVPIGVNTGTDTGALFFLGTDMSASVDVDYRIYVGNAALSMPSASGGMGEQAVFAAYVEAWVLNSLTGRKAGTVLTATNAPTAGQATNMEGVTGYDFDPASSQDLRVTSAPRATLPVSVEALFAADSNTITSTVVSHGQSANSGLRQGLKAAGATTGDPVTFVIRGALGGTSTAASTIGYTAGVWTYAMGARNSEDPGTSIVYLDGANSGAESTALNAFSANRFCIGALWVTTAPTEYFDGKVGVVLISDSVRSGDYAATQYDNLNGDLYSVGAWEALGGDCTSGSTGWVLFTAVAQSSSADMDWTDPGNAIIDDATYAWADLESTVVEDTEYLNLTDMDFDTSTIPAGADSYTVTVRIKRYRGTGGGDEINDLTVQYIDETGTRIGDNKADTGTAWPTSAATVDYTITGHTFDGTEFDEDSGLAFRATGEAGANISQARFVTGWIKVDWDCGNDPSANTRGFFTLAE